MLIIKVIHACGKKKSLQKDMEVSYCPHAIAMALFLHKRTGSERHKDPPTGPHCLGVLFPTSIRRLVGAASSKVSACKAEISPSFWEGVASWGC